MTDDAAGSLVPLRVALRPVIVSGPDGNRARAFAAKGALALDRVRLAARRAGRRVTAPVTERAHRADDAIGRLEAAAEHLQESAREARQLRFALRHEIRTAVGEVGREAGRAAAGFGVAAVGGVLALGLLSVALAVAVAPFVGLAGALALVGVAWAVVAGVGASLGARHAREARADARRHAAHVRREAQDVPDALHAAADDVAAAGDALTGRRPTS